MLLPPQPASPKLEHNSGQQVTPGNLPIDQQPSYAGLFRCIGPHCEDTCCGQWDIPVDKVTYQEYQRFPAEKLGSLVAHFIQKAAGKPHDNLHAFIRRDGDGTCPFLAADRLCEIQREYGAKLLTATCSIYPRSFAVVNGTLEGSLSLSCPEAARAVLLNENSTQAPGNLLSGDFRTDNVFGVRQRPGLAELLLPIRALITALIQDRSRPMWQRLLLIALLCSQLDDSAEHGFKGATQLLGQYKDALGQRPSPELDRLEPRIAVRLELAIKLSDQRCRDRDCGQRFKNVFWDFVEGIGSSGGEGPEEDVRRFREAGTKYLSPFLDRFPFILENYLLNYVYRHVFPFGLAGSDRLTARSMFGEALLLITLFSWWTTLLTGIAGRYGPHFSHKELITTVQSFARAVEHAPQIHEDALAFVQSRNLNTPAGLAALLRG